MIMDVVVRYAKRGNDDKERIRRKIIQINQNFEGDWPTIAAAAHAYAQEGERIVAIIEGGYH
jgi:hypothetical protein